MVSPKQIQEIRERTRARDDAAKANQERAAKEREQAAATAAEKFEPPAEAWRVVQAMTGQNVERSQRMAERLDEQEQKDLIDGYSAISKMSHHETEQRDEILSLLKPLLDKAQAIEQGNPPAEEPKEQSEPAETQAEDQTD